MSGFLSHIDFSVGDPAASIRFYQALLEPLGYRRWRSDAEQWQEPNPTRAAWTIGYPDGTTFGIDLRPALKPRRYDRYEPGPHHIAFDAPTHALVDGVYASMQRIGADILDPPAEYGGQRGYGSHYYAVFIADPDGVKLEVCCTAPP
jgi:catechol 2,3-dioxygenase-like lactoylglutathione lyase family enzyme